jgi:hypothetical protein
MANALYPKTKATIAQAGLDLATVTVKPLLVSSGYVYNAAHQYLSDVSSVFEVATGPALTGVTIGASDASFRSNSPIIAAVTGSSAGENAHAIILFHDTGTPSTSDLIAYIDTGVTGLPFTPSGADEEIVVPAGGWFTL